MQYRQIQFASGGGWRGTLSLILGAALGLGIIGALVLLALGVAIVLLPVVAVGALVGWWRWRRIVASASEAQTRATDPSGRVIEVDYRVIGDEGRDR